MHTFVWIMEYILQGIMFLEMKLTKEKTNYIIVPEHIISYIRKRNTVLIRHLLPSLAATVWMVVSLFPSFSKEYEFLLKQNASIISIVFILTYLPVALIIGFFVEKYLIYRHDNYREYKEMVNGE